MIEVRGLGKRFGGRWVLRNLDLEVRPGQIVALLGPNGAGKTTLLRILASLAKPTWGQVRVAGLLLPAQAQALRAQVGLLAHQPLLYGDLSAEQNLHFFARLYGLDDAEQRVSDLLGRLGLASRRRDPVRIFSRGMQQRLAIGRSILHSPKILLLDEPHTGLDPESAESINSLLRVLANDSCTILLTSHDLEKAAELADRVEVLVGGRLTATFSEGRPKGTQLAELYAKATQRAKESGHAS